MGQRDFFVLLFCFFCVILWYTQKERSKMEEKFYTVASIAGEYAYLRDDSGEEVMIALFLLPDGVDIGTRLRCECFSYEIVE